ncbi:YbjN domain-containing protein [Micromonospora sp. FIMYZ51]|uniref:YbjN domain-containing protein n=1 Tax=Micromonospora sp. FIMYZ51 TaxID=3051832 RepID=UPI00311FC4B0
MPDGEARVAALERVAALAEAGGDRRSALDAWSELVEMHLRGGERWRLFEPVRRCLDAAERPVAPAGEPDQVTLRRYRRYAVEALLGTPRIGLDQARSLLDGLTGGACGDEALSAQLHCRIADHVGDEPAARRWLDRWRAAAGDPAAGCPDCLPVRQAELLAGWGDQAEALATVESVLDGSAHRSAQPSVHCTAQPEAALVGALLPWLRTGQARRAAGAHVRAYRRHRVAPDGFGYLATHLRFCALGGYLDRGLEILVEQLPRLDEPHDDLSVMEIAAAGALVCTLAAQESGQRTVRRPAYRGRPAAEVTVAALGAELLAVATGLAGSFDARNGTGHQSGRMGAWLAERPLVGPMSLAEPASLAEPVPLPADEPDDDPGEPDEPVAGDGSDEGPRADELAALTVRMITAALDRRGDGYALDAAGTVLARWGDAMIQFRRAGERGEILHARVVADRRLPADRRAEAYAFCNGWNRDRLLPKAYVHDPGDGALVLAGEVTTDLAYGVAPAQVNVLVDAAVRTGVAYAQAVAALP